jgi:predicted Zn-dependent peptidase
MLKPITLKNGLTVLRIPKTGSGVCVVGYIAKTGSVFEGGTYPQGISYLIERLFWCGTDKHPSTKSLNLATEALGGTFVSQTSSELTQYYLTVPSYNQFKAVSMMAEIIQRSYFEPKDLEREKKNLVDYLRRSLENMDLEADNFALSATFRDHNLGLPVTGSLDTVLSIESQDIKDYLSHQYCPRNSMLVLAGNFDTKSCVDLIEQEWNLWDPKVNTIWQYPEFDSTQDIGELPRVIYKQRGIPNTHVTIGFELSFGRVFEEEQKPQWLKYQATLLVLNALLGEGLSSRLWTKTVEEEMLFSFIESRIVQYIPTGLLQIKGVSENSQFTFGLESILSTLEQLKKVTVSINELSKAKEYIKGRLLRSHEDILNQVVWQVERASIGHDLAELSDFITAIDTIDVASVRALASDLFIPEKLIISSLGPAKETKLIDKLIYKYLD